MSVSVNVLIPTLCTTARQASVERAIDSALTQEGVAVTVVMVINGQRFDPALRRSLEQHPGLRVYYQPEADLFKARRLARDSVDADFFCWLDDDDVYLPGALKRRVALASQDASIDAVVSNGFIRDGSKDSLAFEDVDSIQRDPVGTLLTRNWLCCAGGLYRTASIPSDYFDITIRSLDMTFLAFRLSLERNIVFLDEPTFRKHIGARSLSTTNAWMLPGADVLRRMMVYPISSRHRRMLQHKLSRMEHELAEYYRNSGAISQAWTHHLSSLIRGNGLTRYALYTRRLLASSAARLLGKSGQSPGIG